MSFCQCELPSVNIIFLCDASFRTGLYLILHLQCCVGKKTFFILKADTQHQSVLTQHQGESSTFLCQSVFYFSIYLDILETLKRKLTSA